VEGHCQSKSARGEWARSIGVVDEESIPLFLQFAQDHSPDGDFIHPLSLRQGGDGGLKGGMAEKGNGRLRSDSWLESYKLVSD
jgi:hypothetical protein